MSELIISFSPDFLAVFSIEKVNFLSASVTRLVECLNRKDWYSIHWHSLCATPPRGCLLKRWFRVLWEFLQLVMNFFNEVIKSWEMRNSDKYSWRKCYADNNLIILLQIAVTKFSHCNWRHRCHFSDCDVMLMTFRINIVISIFTRWQWPHR